MKHFLPSENKIFLKLPFLFFFFLQTAVAQQIMVCGIATDEEKAPVANINVVDQNGRMGVSTNEWGFFTLEIAKQTTVLEFSHVAFETKRVEISKSALRNAGDTLWISVEMRHKIRELDIAEIANDNVRIAHENPKQWILDYELIGENEILLLLIEKNRRFVQLIAPDGDVAKSPVEYKHNKLYKGCFGNIHLLSNHAASQLFLMDDEFILAYEKSIEDFVDVVERIVLATPYHIYQKEVFLRDQKVVYHQIDTTNQSKTVFYDITDRIGKELQREQMNLMKDLIALGEGTDMSMNNSASSKSPIAKSDNREAQVVRMSYAMHEYTLSQEPYAPLIRLGDNLYLFNHIQDKIVIFDLLGNQISETVISYHKENQWDGKIIVNEERDRCFALFSNNGRTTLKELNPDNGKFINEYTLQRHSYPKKISVRGGQIFYLARDYYQGEERYFLWKQEME